MVTPEILPTPAGPADILIAGWDRGKPAALDLTITSPLCSAILSESCHQTGAAALAAEVHKLHSNGPKCQELYCYYYYGCLLTKKNTKYYQDYYYLYMSIFHT